MRHKNFEVTKLVDTFIVTDKVKPYDNPLGGGKLEQWWNDDAEGKHGVKKIGTNRTESGGNKATELSPTVAETLIEFRFKGCEFGNWLSQAERYDVFTAFQRCLSDLSYWLKTKNIGFDNLFGVAFGARGSRGASAHYEPWSNMINMTKVQGSGKLLHEYAHAIDYSIGAFVPGEQNVNYTALSGGTTTNQEKDNVGCQFRAMMNRILLYVRTTESYKRMLKSNKCRARRGYWTNSTELFARLTEAYYAYFYNDNKNYYLVERPLYYVTGNKEDGIYLTKAEIQVIKPEIDKFWKEVALLLDNKCRLKATPFPVVKINPKKEDKEATADTVSKIVQDQAKALKKKNVKSNFKNKYRLSLRVSQGTGSNYTVLMEQKLPSFEFNAHERRQFSVMLKEALTKAGIKVTASEVGGNDGRPVYYLIRVKHLYDIPENKYVDMSISFVDANPEEKKDNPKADSSKKKVVKRPDKLDFDFGKFVATGNLRPLLNYTWEIENYRVATDMFHMAYEELEDSLEEGVVRIFDNKNKLVYSGKQEDSRFKSKYPNVKNAIPTTVNKTVKIDMAKLEKSLQDLKDVVKDNKAKYKESPSVDRYKKSQWLNSAAFVIDEVIFNYKSISIMLYVSKKWKIDKLSIESPYRACIMQNEDGTKKALFMPVSIYGSTATGIDYISEDQKKMLKQRGYFVDSDFMV